MGCYSFWVTRTPDTSNYLFNYKNNSSKSGPFYSKYRDKNDEITVNKSKFVEYGYDDLLKNATGCADIYELKSRLVGRHPQISIADSCAHVTVHDREELPYVNITMFMNDSNNDYIGVISRNIYFSDSYIENDLLRIENRFQKMGCGTLIYQSNEEMWIAAGYKRIELLAGKEYGGYIWATHGFDYHPDGAESSRVRHQEAVVLKLHNLHSQGIINEDSLDKLTFAARNTVYPWQIASFTIPERFLEAGIILNDDTILEVGKNSLKGSSWRGYKELDPNWHGNIVAQETRAFRLGNLLDSIKNY